MIIADEAHFLKAHDVSNIITHSLVNAKQNSGADAYQNEETYPSLRYTHARETEGVIQLG